MICNDEDTDGRARVKTERSGFYSRLNRDQIV